MTGRTATAVALLWTAFGVGICGATVLEVPSEYASIQSALAAAAGGDTVLVAPGTYPEQIDFLGTPVVVGSRYVTTGDPSYIDITVIDGGGAMGPLVTFASLEDSLSVLTGFTVQLGRAPWGGGILCQGSSPRITDCVLLANEAVYDGGGLCTEAGCPIVERCRFESNTAGHSGGGLAVWDGCLRVSDCVLVGNTAHETGGAIFGQSSSPAIRDNLIEGNLAEVSYAGGVMCRNCTAVIEGNVISNNHSNYYGGGLFY
jgi:hypothetical protein